MNQYTNTVRRSFSSVRTPMVVSAVVDGIFVVDKPSGATSFEVVQYVQRLTKTRKVGHTGTLDPLATGVLPVCVGEATKLVPYVSTGKRHYHGAFLLGIETDTLDITGRVLRERECHDVTTRAIEQAMASAVGTVCQTPPQFSAIKYKGRPSYYWARKGIRVPLQPRAVHIEQFQVTERTGQKVFFDLVCSKGTYVRSLVNQIGTLLGCGASLSELRRIACGRFTVAQAIVLDVLIKALEQGNQHLGPSFVPLNEVLCDMTSLEVDQVVAHKLRHGCSVPLTSPGIEVRGRAENGATVKVIHNTAMIALAKCTIRRGQPILTPVRVFRAIADREAARYDTPEIHCEQQQ